MSVSWCRADLFFPHPLRPEYHGMPVLSTAQGQTHLENEIALCKPSGGSEEEPRFNQKFPLTEGHSGQWKQ